MQTWFDECRSLNCTSEYECFLRRPENNCLDAWCTHTSDCTFTVGLCLRWNEERTPLVRSFTRDYNDSMVFSFIRRRRANEQVLPRLDLSAIAKMCRTNCRFLQRFQLHRREIMSSIYDDLDDSTYERRGNSFLELF